MRKVHKFVISFFGIFFILLSFAQAHSSALSEQLFITLKINGQAVFVDADPYIRQNRTFVPVRFIAEAFHMEVEWIPEEKKIVLKDETKTIELWIGSNKLLVNNEELTMDVAVEGMEGRAMVPVRYFAEILDFKVGWDDTTCSVELSKDGMEIPASSLLSRSYTDEDLVWLSRIVEAEVNNLSLEAKVAVANVVLNRIKSSAFPGTVYDVIFDARHTRQFPPAYKEGFKEIVPGRTNVIAAKMALEGVNNIGECLFFNDEPFKGKKEDLYKVIDSEYFYK